MLSKFFTALKPKEYSVQVLRDNTSQKAVKRIKRTRTNAPLKKIATVALVLSFIGGGLASAMAATGVTASQAQANPITDMVCIKGDSDGSWNEGANVYGILGGRAQFSMANNSVGRSTKAGDEAIHGFAGDWGGADAPSGGQYLTAYEKYGMLYPQYDAWVPVYSDKDVTFKQVNSNGGVAGTYATADGKIPTMGGNEVKAGSSPLATSDVGACMALLPTMSAAVANMIAVLPRFVMGASIELYSASYGASMANPHSVLHSLGDSINQFISTPNTGLRDSLFIPFVLPLIIVGAIWVGYVGIVKRAAMQAVQSTAWMILAIALGTIFLAQPTLVASMVDEVVAQTQGIVNEAILKSSKSEDMCNLDGAKNISNTVSADPTDPRVGKTYTSAPDTPSSDTSINITLRETQCTIWHSTIYSTWVAGQFGTASNSASGTTSVLTQTAGRKVLNTDQYAIYYGSSNAKQAKSWPQFMVDRQVTNKSPELSEVAWAQLSGADGAKINHDWSGSIGMISSAIMMFFGAGASSAVLFTYGFALLIYQLMMISAVIMSPFFFLVGIIPNWGRRVLVRYAELLASLAIKRIVTGTLLALYLLFYKIIVGDSQGNLDGLVLRIILIGCLALFFITSRTKFIKMFADNVNFGGNKSIGLPGNKAAAITAGLGVGLLGGGLIGGAIMAHKTRKENKDVEGNLKNIKLEGGNPTADIKTPPRGPNSGANGESNVTPTKVLSKTVNTVRDAKDAKKFVDKGKAFLDKNTAQAAQGSQSASNVASGTTTRVTSTVASKGTTVAPHGMPAASSAASGAAGSAGGAGATVAPVATGAASGGAGIVSGGAAATGSGVGVGVAAGGATGGAAAAAGGTAAVSGTVAAGGVAVTGTVAAGAAAGSVVPVVGTIAGAAAGAAIVAAKQKKKDS